MKKIGKMIVSDEIYEEIIEETKMELRAINQDMLVNWCD